MLLPRMTTSQRDVISSPANGLLIYNTDTSNFEYHDAGTWFELVRSQQCGISATPNYFEVTLDKGDSSGAEINLQVTEGAPGNITTTLASATSGFDITLNSVTNNNSPAPVTQNLDFTLEASSTAEVGAVGQAIFRVESACGSVVFVTVQITISGCDFDVFADATTAYVTRPVSGTSAASFTIDVTQAGSQPGSVNITNNDLSGITESFSNSPCSYSCQTTFDLILDNTVSEGTYVYTLELSSDCGNNKQLEVTLVVEANPRDCKQILAQNPSATDGVYQIDPDGTGAMAAFDCYCDMNTDGGGWTLVLNYLRPAGSDPNEQPRSSSLPLLNSSTLGDDESNTVYWGHASNSLLGEFDIDEVRFYGLSSGHTRVLHFKHDQQEMIDYFQSGIGGVVIADLRNNYTPLPGHNANLPFVAGARSTNQGNRAMLNRPFRSATAEWRINNGNDWEMDDNPNNASNSTLHRVWVRTP